MPGPVITTVSRLRVMVSFAVAGDNKWPIVRLGPVQGAQSLEGGRAEAIT
jgi:hypothetical protein